MRGLLFRKRQSTPRRFIVFARKVAVLLQPNALPLFTHLMEAKVLPWLRLQPGFLDWIILAAPGGGEVATLSFWGQEADAQAYHAGGYPEVLQILEELLDGVPYVKTFEVVSSTFHPVAAESSDLAEAEVPLLPHAQPGCPVSRPSGVREVGI
jgi:hypothetical protein